MNEGWLDDDYVVLFSEAEIESASTTYGTAKFLPSYTVVGLRGWDDFIVRDQSGKTYSVPTVPLDKQYLEEINLPASAVLKRDARFEGKIKWYLKPLAFGGDPNDDENLTWVSHEQHSQLVVWWNNLYRGLKQRDA